MQTHTPLNTISQPANFNFFLQIPIWLLNRPEICALCKLLYARLALYALTSGIAFPSRKRLASDLGISTRSIDRLIRKLKDYRLIKIEQCGLNLPTHYSIPYHPWMDGLEMDSTPTSAENMDSPYVAKPYIDDKIININIYNNKYIPIPRARPQIRKRGFIPVYGDEFEKFWSESPRQVDKIGTYTAFMRALEKTDYDTLLRKQRSYFDQATQKSVKEYWYGSKRWLEEEMWTRDYCQFEWKMATDNSLLPKVTTFPNNHFVNDRANKEIAIMGFKNIRKALAAWQK